MRDTVAKIREILSGPVDSESAVVHLMAEVRKLLERDDETQRMSALWWYCHWVLHADLHNPATVLPLLQPLDTWVTNNVAGYLPTEGSTFHQEYLLFDDLTTLDILRNQFGTFLRGHGLPSDICDDQIKWRTFVALYFLVVEEGALCLETGNQLAAISRVTITKPKALYPSEQAYYRVHYVADLKDGRKINFRFSIAASGMGFHSIELESAPGVKPQPASLVV